MIKRIFDIIVSFLALIALSPIFIILAIAIAIDSKGGIFYKQKRIGKNGRQFELIKFRSMYTDADKKGLLTVGGHDSRITKVGYFIRKYKLDELPQLINVLKGDMSIVGPRPEVKKYTDLYSNEQKKVLNVRPGITDPASLKFKNENDLLEKSTNPEKFYIEKIMPEKIKISINYIDKRNFFSDLKVIFNTLFSVFVKNSTKKDN
jgi:lipopolysaccharide/colanic/teichoic acid biosynthesis glycosyltransferase